MAEPKKLIRCAVYTRKSSEDGLEQEFNSLDAQYEACVAYALSQRHEGWTVVTERYDDGGFSGGNMQRPGLVRLMADIEAGRVDIILLYKIDRLTRSLSDFARIVDVLDSAGASFVSITQSFNTTTSMGRLTLNMLLSFAQFEREITGERIRDKIAASKRKGIWMGGPVPLGYDVVERKLVANESEAKLVRHIMKRYVVLGSVKELGTELDRSGYRTKVQIRTNGTNRGCCKFSKGMLSHILGNRIYLGMIVHKGDAYPGEHAPIVTQDLWDAVQTARAERASGPSTRIGTSSPSLLRGRLLDGESRAMKPSHATKPNRRYRYYVTRPDLIDISPAWRVPAHDLETMVFNEVARLLTDRHRVHDLLGDAADAAGLSKVFGRADTLADTLRSGSAGKRLTALHAIVHQVQLHEDAVIITIEPTKLLEALGVENTDGSRTETIILSCNAVRIRRGQEVRLVIPPNNDNLGPVYRDEKLVALVAKARATVELIIASPESSIGAIAVKHGRCRVRFAKLAELSCLAPDIVVAIVEGRQPISLTPRRLLATHLPLDWQGQRAALGFS